ncbi:Hypothetical Protein FCC1311_109372 [Hondaea fermentalgiana]|uniref:Uncharacterized protein n=1 Tax=Hondaea fermentalgiana TaxID=2315210 RepID=A0A2R5GVW8_9STRA|nr:Hypothetical Protein FCC1311_109372 [Hondaea fermentalgiana]|eukprot:GBG34715.1 Hypothetical Protein FCC1311_109372 [Hondaea fermentalgiana]
MARAVARTLALVALAVALGGLGEVEALSRCGAKRYGHIADTCNYKPRPQQDNCKRWASRNLIRSIAPFTSEDQLYMVRKYERCSRQNFQKVRCCWQQVGDSYRRQVASRRTLQDLSEDDETVEFACANPVQLENGTWTDIEFYVSGDVAARIPLPDGNYSIPFFPLVSDIDPPSVCSFILFYLKYNSPSNEFVSQPQPKPDVVDLSQPSSGSCSPTPNAEICSCSSLDEDPDCPNYCLELERYHRCTHCSHQECAAICDSIATCAGIEYHNKSETCKLMLHPEFSTTADLRPLGGSNNESFPSFTIGLSLEAPPLVEDGSADGSTTCYGRSESAALNAKAVELKTSSGQGGMCAVSDPSYRVQRCGPSGFNNVGLCGAAACSMMCAQDPSCQAYDMNLDVDEGLCFLIYEELPTEVVEGTSDSFRCYVIDRDVTDVESDWYNLFVHVGYRDVASEPNGTGLNLANLLDNNVTGFSETGAPTPSPVSTCKTGGCSLNCKKSSCCKSIGLHGERCCYGVRFSDTGRTCCTYGGYYSSDEYTCCTKIRNKKKVCSVASAKSSFDDLLASDGSYNASDVDLAARISHDAASSAPDGDDASDDDGDGDDDDDDDDYF